jgi:hypothetical protein
VSGLFSVFGKLANQANLGEEIAYEFNKEHGVWLKKVGKFLENSDKNVGRETE